MFGKELLVLTEGRKEAGKFEFVFDNNLYQLKPGTYFFGLQANDQTLKRKMVLAQ
jgi:hypothetical protein